MRAFKLSRLASILALFFCLLTPAMAQTADIAPLFDALGPGSFSDREAAANALAATGDPRVPAVLQALSDGDLYVRESDGKVVLATKAGSDYALTDPVDGADLGTVAKGDIEKVK